MSDQTTPPPPAANPSGEQPPAQPMGDQPAQPGEQTPVHPQASPEKKPGAAKKVLSILVPIVVVLVIVGLKYGARNLFADEVKTANAKVGDCLGELPGVLGKETTESADIVKCDGGAAKYTVVGRVDNPSPEQADSAEGCSSFERTEIVYHVRPKDGGKGYVLCLKDASKAAK